MRYPNTLRDQRTAKQLSQWDVAKVVDIHLNRYGRLEAGKIQPSFAEGVRLGAFFAVEPAVLFPAQEANAA
jgi:predicted transcriptional regulator